MGLFQSPQNVETNKMRSWELQLQDGTKVTVNNRWTASETPVLDPS